MKKITIEIEDSIFNSLSSFMKIKMMCGNAYGEEDEFLILMCEAIEDGKDSIVIYKKKKGKKS